MPVSPETVGAATEALGVEGMSRVGRRARVIWDNVYTIKTNRMECERPTPLRKIGEAWRLKKPACRLAAKWELAGFELVTPMVATLIPRPRG